MKTYVLFIWKGDFEMKECFELLVLLGMAVASNIALGIYSNIGSGKESFDKKKLINGILKAICVSVGFLGLSYILCELPDLATALGIEPKAMMISAVTVYVTKATTTLLGIFGIKKVQTEKVVAKVEQTVKEDLEEEYLDM